MGKIEARKQIEREDAFEKAIEKGFEIGFKKAKTEVVTNFLTAGNFSISQIANFVNVSESFVREIKKEQNK